jgi:hypothetical protein
LTSKEFQVKPWSKITTAPSGVNSFVTDNFFYFLTDLGNTWYGRSSIVVKEVIVSRQAIQQNLTLVLPVPEKGSETDCRL